MRIGAGIAVGSAILAFFAAHLASADRVTEGQWQIRYCAALYFVAETPFDAYYRKHAKYPAVGRQARSIEYYMDRRRFANHLAADREAPNLASHKDRFAWIISNSYELWDDLEPIMLADTCGSEFCAPDKGSLAAEFSSCSALMDAAGFSEWMSTRKDYADWNPSKFSRPDLK